MLMSWLAYKSGIGVGLKSLLPLITNQNGLEEVIRFYVSISLSV